MNITESLVLAAKAANHPSLFPFPFSTHLIFCCISLVFFIFQFSRQKKPYQLIMGFAIPFSLVMWLSESRTLFYAVGITEAVLFIAALVTAIIFKEKNENDENADTDNSEANAEITDKSASDGKDTAEEK